jgi:hypothetical protein
MLTLVLISFSAAFFIALINTFLSMPLLKLAVALLSSILGTYLTNVSGVGNFILYSLSGAFIGTTLVVVAERLNTYQPAVIRAVGTER